MTNVSVVPRGRVLMQWYVAALQQYKALIWIILLITTGVLAVLAPRFVSATTQNVEPPSDSDAAQDREEMNSLFPRMEHSSDLVLYIQRPKPGGVLSPNLENFSYAFCDRALDLAPTRLINCGGYYTYEEVQRGQGSQFLSDNGEATFITLTVDGDCTSKSATDYANSLVDHVVPEVQKQFGCDDYQMTLMGCSVFLRVMIDNAADDLEHMDAIVLPLALLTLAAILQSVRLLVAAVVSLLFAAAASFGLMYLVTFSMDVFASAPSLMMSVLIAMSIDYGLFLLSRYSEELKEQLELDGKVDVPRAVVTMLYTAGHTITVSGLTLTTCFAGLLAFRVNLVQSFGVGCSVVLVVVLLMNLLVIPLLLLTFPSFFAKCRVPNETVQVHVRDTLVTQQTDDAASLDGSYPSPDCSVIAKDKSIHQQGRSITLTRNSVESAEINREEADGVAESTDDESGGGLSPHAMVDSRWFKFGMFVSSFPVNVIVIVVVLGAVAPFSLRAFSYTTTDENILYLPKGNAVTNAYADMGATFGYGQVFSYQIVMAPTNDSRKILDESDGYQLWHLTQLAVRGLVTDIPGFSTRYKDFTGASQDGQAPPIGPDIMYSCLNMSNDMGVNCTDFLRDPGMIQDETCRGNLMLACAFMNNPIHPDQSTAMWFRFTPQFAPMSNVGKDWLHHAREFAEEFSHKYPMRILFVGTPADAIDSMATIDDDFLPMVLITTGVLFAFLFVSFKSLFIPLRSVATIAVTIIWVYGFATMTYEDCNLTWTGFSGFDCTHAVVYIIPLMSFSIVVGIGLDYDVFLVTRIVECYYDEGFSTQDAICQGLARTGYLITAAGVIMALAFCGLFFSKEPFMHQLSFYMVFAVLFDTFVVRSLLVPALMGLLGELNWWPFAKRPKKNVLHNSFRTERQSLLWRGQ
eukprot:TRINITY_DN1936_c0_g2_i1.p1 TRINITY_DN1936_c0_g2~~TRINITY_DN1936_c0_g2_i1.p1  ORF type:complete len:915 (+),score=310.96 TRINITY_DN1936_c0_g2_i1:98-2842(+)